MAIGQLKGLGAINMDGLQEEQTLCNLQVFRRSTEKAVAKPCRRPASAKPNQRLS